MLEKFAAAKEAEIAALVKAAERGELPAPWQGARPSFASGLRQRAAKNSGLAVIAEYKRASPSKGEINLDLQPEDVAAAYAQAGADAVSVLTEELYFKGSLEYLQRMTGPGLPLLRKDFLLHPAQAAATAATPASALLIIVRMLPRDLDLAAMLQATAAAGLDAVVEVFDEADLERAQSMNVDIIQVNNRNLDTLDVDLAVSERLAARKRDGELWISASGLAGPADMQRVSDASFDAVLAGTALMAGGDPATALRKLMGKRI